MSSPPPTHLPRHLLLGLAVLLAGPLAALTLAAFLEGKRVDIVTHDLRPAGAPQALRLVQISDLHLSHFGPHEQTLAKKVRGLNADVVVLTGDAIDRADALPLLQSFVQALKPAPVLLVPGNWEHWSGIAFGRLQSTLAAQGAKLLLNERWTLARGDRSLTLIGLDDFTAGQPDLQLLNASASNPDGLTVVVQHSPAFFDQAAVTQRMAGQDFGLCLAGHTHGGQIALGNWAPFTPPGSGRFVAGFYDLPSCRLFVSRGAGTSVLPLRWGAKAEVLVFDF